MRSRTTVFLIVALIACIAYIVFRPDGPGRNGKPDSPGTTTGPLLSDPPKEYIELAISSQSGQLIKLRLIDKAWRIVEPLSAAAIPARVEALAGEIVSLKCLQRYELNDPKAPAENITGLSAPRLTVSIEGADGKKAALKIGRYVPLSGKTRTYAAIAGDDRICIVSGDPSEALARPISHYRSRNILAIPSDSIASLRVEGSETWTLDRRADRWILSPGTDKTERFGADKPQVEQLLAHFEKIDAIAFADDAPSDLAPYGLAPDEQRLAITLAYQLKGSDKPISRTLRIGLKTGQSQEAVFAKLGDHPTVFTLPASLLDDLQPGQLKLRDKAVLSIKPKSVTALEITIDSDTMTLAKTDGKWNVVAPTKARGAQQRLELLIKRLASLRARDFRSEKATEVEFGFKKPRGVIRMFQTGVKDPLTLTIGAESPSGAAAFVQSSGADVVATVGSEEVGVFLAALPRYYDPVLWMLPDKTDVSRIALKRPAGPVELLGSTDGKWRMVKPLDAPVDVENVNSVLDQLDNLTATRIVSVGAKTRAYYARGASPISATFEVRRQESAAAEPKHKPQTFSMAIIDRKVYGWMADDPLGRVGLFSGKIYMQLAAEMRQRKVLDFDNANISGIALAASGKVMVLQKFDSGWKYPDDPELKIDQDAVNGYLDHVKTARALQFVSSDAGAPDKKFGLKRAKAWMTLELTTADRKTIRISVSRKGSDETTNRYASVSGLQGVFTLSAQTAASLVRKISDFK
jgi:hypothetical protein